MAAPFKPYSKDINLTYRTVYGWNATKWRLTATGTKQVPPYVNTVYNANIYEQISQEYIDANSWSVVPSGSGAAVEATNRARAKFVVKLGDSSSFGATLLAERRETFGMMVSGVTSALLAARAVKRGQLGRAAHHLGIEPPQETTVVRRVRSRKGRYRSIKRLYYVLPGVRDGAKALGNKWLWYSYGVAPLMGDIHNGMDVLQRPVPELRLKGTGTGKSYSRPSNTFFQSDYHYDSKVSVSAVVRVRNPNLWLANQLGLVNPIQVFNEAIPFSFVIDWFSNLSQVIMQMTDFVGLDIIDPVTASRHRVVYTQRTSVTSKLQVKSRTQLQRVLSVPSAKLVFKYERFEWQRGANAISLLVQFLKKK